MARFAGDAGTILFESKGAPGPRARYSYLCVAPLHVVRAQAGHVTLDGSKVSLEPLALVRQLLRDATPPSGDRQPPGPPQWNGAASFQGGAAGFMAYEFGASLDRIPRAPGLFTGIPDLQFGIYQNVFAWDHARRRFWFTGDPSLAARMQAAAPPLPEAPDLLWSAATPRETHMARVARAQAFIRAGDIYQANITTAFTATRPPGLDPAALYVRLRAGNPAPFSAFINCGGGCAVASVSPERFLRLDAAGWVEARPIKGTQSRGATPAEDARLAAELLASAKDRAENLMIVDLLRNDLARVAQPGSVTVPELCVLESFANVHHLVSAVTAQLRPGMDGLDLLRAGFPGGSITGAPKLRATEIIAELEGAARGPYCGSAVWLGFDGAMDSNILIRTITVAADRIVAQAGGGIVADSVPAAEWDEVMTKIRPILAATGTLA